jgi:hypothetical protein
MDGMLFAICRKVCLKVWSCPGGVLGFEVVGVGKGVFLMNSSEKYGACVLLLLLSSNIVY